MQRVQRVNREKEQWLCAPTSSLVSHLRLLDMRLVGNHHGRDGELTEIRLLYMLHVLREPGLMRLCAIPHPLYAFPPL